MVVVAPLTVVGVDFTVVVVIFFVVVGVVFTVVGTAFTVVDTAVEGATVVATIGLVVGTGLFVDELHAPRPSAMTAVRPATVTFLFMKLLGSSRT